MWKPTSASRVLLLTSTQIHLHTTRKPHCEHSEWEKSPIMCNPIIDPSVHPSRQTDRWTDGRTAGRQAGRQTKHFACTITGHSICVCGLGFRIQDHDIHWCHVRVLLVDLEPHFACHVSLLQVLDQAGEHRAALSLAPRGPCCQADEELHLKEREEREGGYGE